MTYIQKSKIEQLERIAWAWESELPTIKENLQMSDEDLFKKYGSTSMRKKFENDLSASLHYIDEAKAEIKKLKNEFSVSL